jgi:Flp pilus assembly protein TadD
MDRRFAKMVVHMKMAKEKRSSETGIVEARLGRSYSVRTLLLIDGKLTEGRKLQCRLIRDIRRAIAFNPPNPRLWCLLGDHYKATARQAHCYRQALRADPYDPEANAELAYICACAGDRRRFERYFERVLDSCRGFDIEDFVIYQALDAAREIKDSVRERRALNPEQA